MPCQAVAGSTPLADAVVDHRRERARQVRSLIEFAAGQGYGRDEVIEMIRDLPQEG